MLPSWTFDFSSDPWSSVAITSLTQPLLDSAQLAVFLTEVWRQCRYTVPSKSHSLCSGQFHWTDDWSVPVTWCYRMRRRLGGSQSHFIGLKCHFGIANCPFQLFLSWLLINSKVWKSHFFYLCDTNLLWCSIYRKTSEVNFYLMSSSIRWEVLQTWSFDIISGVIYVILFHYLINNFPHFDKCA